MATQPGSPPPDTIEPGSPQEVPPQQTPGEEPMYQPDEVSPTSPDTIEPSPHPLETPPPPD